MAREVLGLPRAQSPVGEAGWAGGGPSSRAGLGTDGALACGPRVVRVHTAPSVRAVGGGWRLSEQLEGSPETGGGGAAVCAFCLSTALPSRRCPRRSQGKGGQKAMELWAAGLGGSLKTTYPLLEPSLATI